LDKNHLLLDTLLNLVKRISFILNIKAIILAIIFPIALYGLYFLVLKDSGLSTFINNEVPVSPLAAGQGDTSENVKENLVNVETPIQSGTFTSGEAAKYIPYDADFIVEVADFKTFGELFAKFDSGYSPINQWLGDKIFPAFAFFGIQQGDVYVYGGIFFIKNVNGFDTEFLKDYAWLKSRVSGNVLCLTTDEAVASEFQSVASELTKSLDKNPTYVIKKKTLPSIGRLSIAIMNKKAWEKINGVKETVPQELKNLVSAFEKSKLDHGVIL
jgi:hypothetical protein